MAERGEGVVPLVVVMMGLEGGVLVELLRRIAGSTVGLVDVYSSTHGYIGDGTVGYGAVIIRTKVYLEIVSQKL